MMALTDSLQISISLTAVARNSGGDSRGGRCNDILTVWKYRLPIDEKKFEMRIEGAAHCRCSV